VGQNGLLLSENACGTFQAFAMLRAMRRRFYSVLTWARWNYNILWFGHEPAFNIAHKADGRIEPVRVGSLLAG